MINLTEDFDVDPMLIHRPVTQYFYPVNECPRCSGKIAQSGVVTDAPLAVQSHDQIRGITRSWEASRYHCEKCDFLFDVVTSCFVVTKAKTSLYDLVKQLIYVGKSGS